MQIGQMTLKTARFMAVLAFVVMPIQALAQASSVDVPGLISGLKSESTGPVVRSMASSGGIPLDPTSQIPAAFDFPTVQVQVGFDDNSLVLTAAGMIALRSVAAALQDPGLAGSRFQIGAHVIQDKSLNALPVSSRRAAAVVDHLTVFYGISKSKLIPVGYGNTKLVDQVNQTNPANERLELINIDALK